MGWVGAEFLRRLLSLVLLFSLSAVAVVALNGGFAFDVRISEESLNRTAAAKLPLGRKVGPVVWRVEAAKLTVLERGRIGVDANLHATAGGREADAHVAGSGMVTYRDGAFWLSGIHVETLDHVVVRKTEGPEHRPSALGKAIGGLVARHEALKEALDDIKDDAIALALKHADGVLDAIFANIPVYRLHDDWKGAAARQALVSVGAEGHELVATVDPFGHALGILVLVLAVLILLYDVLCLLAGFTSLLGAAAKWLLFWW